MFFKEILNFIVTPILLVINSIFGSSNTQVYVAPPTTSEIVENKIEITEEKPKATTTKTAVKNKTNATTTTKTVQKIETTQPTTTPPKAIEVVPNFELINQYARESLVNILCTTKRGSLSPISGTGIIVKPDGLILTNAHVGQYLLLKDFQEKNFIECVARTGSPAYPKYNIELVYISPTWVANNKSTLKQENPKGTGENDFAFLRITKNIDNSELPKKFSFIQMNVRENIDIDESVLLASYPAGFLGGLSIIQNLNIASSITTIMDIFTFKDGSVDLISTPGTIVSQKGSSGGAVVDKYATLIGLISTSSEGSSTKDRDLRAITMSYIDRAMQNELKVTLEQFVNGNSAVFAKKFQEINAPGLTKLITDELLK